MSISKSMFTSDKKFWETPQLKGCITVDGRTLMTANEVKSFLREQLAMGRRVLPMGDCDNFDYQTGCKGHVVEED